MTTAVRASATNHLNNMQFANQGAAPATPASGYHRLYFTSGGLKWVNSAGSVNAALDVQSLTISKPSGTVSVNLSGAVGTNREYRLTTNGSLRFTAALEGTSESGGNAGSNFVISRFSDAGAWLEYALEITRSTGNVRVSTSLEIDGALDHDGSTAGFYGNTPVARQTYGAPTGTATRTTFATGSVTLAQLAERVKALIDDLRSVGLLG